MKLPKRVTICEVGTRDGFQIEPEFVPTEEKIEVVNRLSATGMPRIEVTSFVSPKAVPMLKDAEAVMAGITPRPGPRPGCKFTGVRHALNDRPRAPPDDVSPLCAGGEGGLKIQEGGIGGCPG